MDEILFLLDFYDMWIFYATSTLSRQKNFAMAALSGTSLGQQRRNHATSSK
jgi:hypothetical protein